jgi:hypothetical protein
LARELTWSAPARAKLEEFKKRYTDPAWAAEIEFNAERAARCRQSSHVQYEDVADALKHFP